MSAPEAAYRHRDQMGPRDAYVLRTVEERGVRFVRLWFVDVLGILKSLAIPVSAGRGRMAFSKAMVRSPQLSSPKS